MIDYNIIVFCMLVRAPVTDNCRLVAARNDLHADHRVYQLAQRCGSDIDSWAFKAWELGITSN